MNNKRVVVGDIKVEVGNGSITQAALWKDGVLAPLPIRPSVAESEAYAVSDQGRVAGMEFSASTGDVHAVFWDTRSGPIQIGPLSIDEVDFTLAQDVDALGNVVGTSAATNVGGNHPFLGFYAPGGGVATAVGAADLDASGGSSAVGAISGNGTTLLGRVTGTTSRDGYYLWSAAAPAAAGTKIGLTPAPNLGFRFLAGSVYNQLLLHNALASDGTVLGFRDDGPRKWYLRAPNGQETEIVGLAAHNAINAKHVVAGTIATGNAQDPVHAAIWDPVTKQVTDLNTLLPPNSGFRLVVATAINDEGDVAGVALHNQLEVGFLLNGAPEEVTLTMTATPPQPEGARSGETVHYTLDAQMVRQQATTLVVTATMGPAFLEVDAGSITGGGILAGDTITWHFSNTSGTVPPLAFDASVKQGLADTVLFLPAKGHAVATLADASEAEADADATIPYLKSNLAIQAALESPHGDYVLPEDELVIRLSASAKTTASDLVLDAAIPVGTTLVKGSITGGGKSSGGKVRWTYTNVDQTPEVQFTVRLLEQKKLKKEQKEIVADFFARGTFDGSEETASQKLEIDIVRTTDIRGIVRDIELFYPKRYDVKTPPLEGVEVKIFDSANVLVDEEVTDKKGAFSLRLSKAGNYRLEARRLGDVYSQLQNKIDLQSRYIRAIHFVKLEDDGKILVDGVELERDGKGIAAPFDAAYVPLSLVRRASDLIFTARNFRIDYLFLVKLDISPLLGDLVHYDTAKAAAMLDAAIQLETFINHDGTLAHFKGLYRGSGDKDPWNAVIRLCAFLVQHDRRVQEAARLSDALAKTVALAATTNFVGNVLPKMTPRWKKLLGGSTAPPLEGQAAVIGRALKTAKIGTMAFGCGAGLPIALEAAGIVGQDKAQYIELIAKGLRYGTNIVASRYLPGAMREDITFEELFNLIRIGVDLAMMEAYVTSTQEPLDKLADLLKLGVFDGDTFTAYNILDSLNDRLARRTQNVLVFFGSVLADISILRGAEGVLGISTPFLKAPTAAGPFAKPIQFFKSQALDGGKNLKNAGKWLVPIQYTLVIGTIVDEMILRRGDIIKIEEAAFSATGTDKAVRVGGPVVPGQPVGAGEGEGRAAKFKPPKVPKAPPTAEFQAYLDVVARITKLVGKNDTAGYVLEREALVAAHDAVFDALDALYDRGTLALPLVPAAEQVNLLSFLEARNALAQTASAAYSFVETWATAEDSAKQLKGSVKKVLTLLPQRANEANGFFGGALNLVAGLALPGGIIVEPVVTASSTAILTGAPFDLQFVAKNPGDAAVAASEAELIPGDTLDLVSGPIQPVPALDAGEAVTLTWQVRSMPESPAGFTGTAQVVVSRDGAIVAIGTDTIAEYDEELTIP